MYKVTLLDGNIGELLHTIHIPSIPRHGESITIESSSTRIGFVTYDVDYVHYVHNVDNETFSVILYVTK
jgi:hypothetical protein